MGFSSALQGRAAHEALLNRQEAELKLLETMKRCLIQKSKCDKEYAASLAAVTQQGLKVDRSDDLQGNLNRNALLLHDEVQPMYVDITPWLKEIIIANQ
ncbi:conserved hypothetical protein [Culex quinquefasciatus]|uniref:FCH domain-containing protein n=1 Tax=Culex quinquefasciatus TaxID=7176 RepID=B0WF52_CULQU|nr:conserved hypothetical protein [Culex quinquefasciatus]|eukprot:XP_001847336.1 conserved hypothetical protein [Culex quinquefasciatus]